MERDSKMQGENLGFLPFDPIVLVQDVAKRWLLVLLVALMVGVGTYIVSDLSYQPQYKTTMTFVVTDRDSNSTVYNNLSSTNTLATVFSELLNSSILRKSILQEIGSTSFDGTIHAAVVPETNLLTVTVTASDPRTAFLVAQAIIEHHETVTYQVVDGIALEVLQNPTIPTAPQNSTGGTGRMKKAMLLAAVAMVALLGGMSYLRDTIRSGKEAKSKLDCAYLGEIPHEEKYKTLLSKLRHRKSGVLITNPTTSFRYVETIRKLRRRIEQRMQDGKVLMVTSLVENEGKSTVAANLALSMARKHKRVLLIDCDLRKPACQTLLEVKSVPYGLRDVLTGKARLNEAMIQDKKSGLFLLLEKRGSSNSGDLLAGEKMQALLTWAGKEFDCVILDMPPMALVSDAESMMEYVDASLLVVRQNVAVAAAVNQAASVLEGGKAKFLGCVLNNVCSFAQTVNTGHGHDSYGYYGRYGAESSGK